MTRVAPAPNPTLETAPRLEPRPARRKFWAEHVRALLVFNALYFGVAALAAGYAFLNSAVQSALTAVAVDAFSPSGGLRLWWHAVFTRPGARWSAWRQGLVLQRHVYAAVVALLAIAAIYEAFEVIWILPAVAPV